MEAFLEWDTFKISEYHVNELMQQQGIDEDTAWGELHKDSDIFECEWEWFIESFNEFIETFKADQWDVRVENFGWQNRCGTGEVAGIDGEHLLRNILPKTDCTFSIYKTGDGFSINNFHHDSPTGEWYYVNPSKEGLKLDR